MNNTDSKASSLPLTEQIKLIVVDIDGTLLNHQHKITDLTKQTVEQLIQAGYEIMLASGRHFQDVYLIAQQLGVQAGVITSNGARVHNHIGEVIYEDFIPADLVARVLDLSKGFEVHRNIYQQDLWLVEEPHEELLAIHHLSGFEYQFRDFNKIGLEQIDNIYFTAQHDLLVELESVLRSRLGDLLNITFTSAEYLEVMNLGVSKGHALEMIMRQKGLTADQVMAFGDGMNDKEMLATAGHGVVMGNASQKLKGLLPQCDQADSNREDGLANYLQAHFFN
jgi:Cof subfamily protein (haloacid dehalogenase superfamily)